MKTELGIDCIFMSRIEWQKESRETGLTKIAPAVASADLISKLCLASLFSWPMQYA